MQPSLSFVYFGSFRVSADILAGLLDAGLKPNAVVASPDRPAGKKKILTAPAVKQLLLERGLDIALLQPQQPTDIIEKLKKLSPDFFLVMGYPHILPQDIINIPRLGTIGIHPSLLPKYRGASPMQTALLEGETETGITLYQIDTKMDHGPIISQSRFSISPNETNASLEKKAAHEAAQLVTTTYKKIPDIKLIEQDHAAATVTKKFRAADSEVDFVHDEPLKVYRKIQAFTPEPGVWTMNFPGHEGKRVKLLAASLRDEKIHITSIQVEGKKPIVLK